MKIAYIGASDGLAEALAELMVKEGNDFYLVSDKELPQKLRVSSQHRFYRAPRKGESFGKLLISISPDCVIFAGNHFINSIVEEESDADITLLTRSLRTATTLPNIKFILLSSIEVYGNTAGKAEESAKCNAVSERGIRFIREEQLLDIYRKKFGMDAAILRVSQLYTNRPSESGDDFLSRSFSSAQAEVHVRGMFQPLNVSDFADAVKRVIDSGAQYIYNVCGSSELSAERLYQLICQQEGIEKNYVRWEDPSCVTLADSGQIRLELEWNDSENLEKLLQEGKITYERTSTKEGTKGRNRKNTIFPEWIRELIENLLIFVVFFALNYVCASNNLFSKINWLMIYVIVIAISYNVFQSTLAAILASAAYLYSRNLNLMELNGFYSYADSLLAIVEFIALGLIISHTIDMFREEARSARLDLEMQKEEYDDLKDINEENVLIKNEYEGRLLMSKTGLSKLYSMISRLMVQEPDRILMETIQVISELLRTDTVAVYQGKEGSSQLQLVGALSDNSIMDGKTWDLTEYPRIYNAVERGELYQGELGSGEPAAVLPIVGGGVSVAVVLIKTLPYECETLYHFNLLKTMSLMLRDSMGMALRYEEMSREMHYVMGTDILRPEEFRKRVLVAKEKAEKSMAEYCVVELVYSSSLDEIAYAVSQALHVTDCMGIDEDYKLFALLNNTNSESLEPMRKRLLTCGVEARLIPNEQVAV